MSSEVMGVVISAIQSIAQSRNRIVLSNSFKILWTKIFYKIPIIFYSDFNFNSLIQCMFVRLEFLVNYVFDDVQSFVRGQRFKGKSPAGVRDRFTNSVRQVCQCQQQRKHAHLRHLPSSQFKGVVRHLGRHRHPSVSA